MISSDDDAIEEVFEENTDFWKTLLEGMNVYRISGTYKAG